METKKAALIASLITILLLALFSVAIFLSNQRLHGEEYRALAEQLLEEAREEFESIRGVSVREVTLEVVNVSWVIENWGKAYSDPKIAEILREEKIYKALFMISQDDSLYDANLDWTERVHAAKWQNKIYIVEENFRLNNHFSVKSTFVHELTHIHQESFSMPKRPSTFDGDKARSSLTEGDATLMANTFRGEGVNPSVSSIIPDEKILSLPMMILFSDEIQFSLPDTVDDLKRFSYRYGVGFVEELYEQGGWGAVEEAYGNPPNTTEQIMHPEKYFGQEDAIPVEAPLMSGDWNLTENEKFGEYFIIVMLDRWISKGEAEQAAEGWGGDNLTYYERGDEYLFTWNIAWDSLDDAHEFYLAFQEMMDKTSAEKENGNCWSANGRYLSIQWNESSTLIISSDNETIVQSSYN
ncbi:MAG: hypothetical protein JSW14_03100 [Candidatus Bathyarchaeum sp.]|nr:MAG: hypothetical protein JSW14_03100 [Candidatus Bathyarchaeum sp.]